MSDRSRGPGRPPIGEVALVQTTVRVSPPLLTRYEMEARRRGISIGALIREVLERGCGAMMGWGFSAFEAQELCDGCGEDAQEDLSRCDPAGGDEMEPGDAE